MTAVASPVNDKDRAAHERMGHYTTEVLAQRAASMIALSHGDPEPMVPFACKVCGEWCLSTEGTGVPVEDRPSRGSRKERAARARAEYEARAAAAAAAWSS